MLIITVKVNAPLGLDQGVKEAVAMELERYGDTRVVSIVEEKPEQTKIGEYFKK